MASGYRETVVNRGGNAARFVNEPIPNRSITTVFINCCPAFALLFPPRLSFPFRAIFISCLSIYPYFLLFYLSSNLSIPNFLFPTAAKLFLWIVVEKFLPLFLVCPSIFSFLFVFRFNVFQSFSNSCQIIVMSRSCSREIPSVYFFSHSARSLSLVSIVVQLSISLYPFFCLLFVFESFDSTFSNLFPTAAKLLLHLWISCSKEISSVYFLSVRLSLFYLFLLFVFESFD